MVNGCETEPASAKDRLLLSRLPHLVLDGAVLAARAVGAREVIVKVGERRGRAGAARSRRRSRVRPRRSRPRSASSPAPSGYVTGEESAVVHYLNGGDAVPTFVPPRPYERGYRGRPTLVQNPETLAQLALVARFGDALVPRARHRRRPRLGAGDDLRRGGRARASTSSPSAPR